MKIVIYRHSMKDWNELALINRETDEQLQTYLDNAYRFGRSGIMALHCFIAPGTVCNPLASLSCPMRTGSINYVFWNMFCGKSNVKDSA